MELQQKGRKPTPKLRNRVMKAILTIPQGAPFNIILAETGQTFLECTVKKKKTMHARKRKSQKVMQRITNLDHSSRKK